MAGGGLGHAVVFELTFGMALDHFVRSGCDIVVLETGMGGRLDSTNVVPTAEACAITNIGWTINNSSAQTFEALQGKRPAF